MEKTKVDGGHVLLEIPEGFRLMEAKDFAEFDRECRENEWAIKNDEKHLIYDVTWKGQKMIMRLVSVNTIADNTAALIKVQIPSFEKLCDVRIKVGGKKAAGFMYSYVKKDIKMVSVYMVVKHGDMCYAFSCIGRDETFRDQYDIFDEMLKTVEFH